MNVYCEGTAEIRHKDTGVVYDIDSDELSFDAVGSDERPMGVELRYEAIVEHPALGQLGARRVIPRQVSKTIAPPTLTGTKWSRISTTNSSVAKPGLVRLQATGRSLYGLHGLLLSNRRHAGRSRKRGRTLPAEQDDLLASITALESYLSDRLLRAVLDNREAMNRLMAHDKDFRRRSSRSPKSRRNRIWSRTPFNGTCDRSCITTWTGWTCCTGSRST